MGGLNPFSLVLRLFFICSLMGVCSMQGQDVEILSYEVDEFGQAKLVIESSPNKYYLLKVRHNGEGPFTTYASMTLGEADSTTIKEPLGAYPLENYQVIEHSISNPSDSDADGIDDITELANLPNQSPFNFASVINEADGKLGIDSLSTFNALSVQQDVVQWSEYLNDKEYLKYIIVDFDSDQPRVYFMNTNTYSLHKQFANEIGIDFVGEHIKKGHIIYHPTVVSNNGTLGTYAFNYSNAEGFEFEIVQRTQELLAANMPFLENNMAYYVNAGNEPMYQSEISLYENSRVSVIFESDVYAGIDYWGLNQTEGYGFLRQLDGNETPGPKDIVLLETLPFYLPRVGGIITSVIQTPLSHVNLRAIQNDIPNSFIRNPLSNDTIAGLLNHYVYYKVEQDKYTLREASADEVDDWFENIRPTEEQEPPLNLNYTSILPLDEISFDMYDGFGAKCTNVATMRKFGFPEETIPNGFGVPFYFYQKYMEYNGFFDLARELIESQGFESNSEVRQANLAKLRSWIENGSMPDWMMDELAAMHATFPEGTSVRCRSSTNNEDLPGFSGAGLYVSKTQHPDEGHIAKSIKQVYASLWNFRAFEEREFYRVDHFIASMGVLCHPNYSDEKVNGVGVTDDPVYGTSENFYLNSQLGEDLITNPSGSNTAEEILLRNSPNAEEPFVLIQRSSLLPSGEILMDEVHLSDLRAYMHVIHQEFEKLYNAEGNDTFAMDIEYKITSENDLAIKQARPWVSYKPTTDNLDIELESNKLFLYPNPAQNHVNIRCNSCNLNRIRISDLTGKNIIDLSVEPQSNPNIRVPVFQLPEGIYIVAGYTSQGSSTYSQKLLKLQ